jgi:hypothetical protein
MDLHNSRNLEDTPEKFLFGHSLWCRNSTLSCVVQAAVAYYRKDKERIDKGLPRPPKATPVVSAEASVDGEAAGQESDGTGLRGASSQGGARSEQGGEEDDGEESEEEEEEQVPHEVGVIDLFSSFPFSFVMSTASKTLHMMI